MSSDDQPADVGAGDFTPWPRPVPAHVLSGVKKILLVVTILVGVHQILPSTSLGSSLSSTFTLLVMLSWLAPLTRILASKPWVRKGSGEQRTEG